MLQALRKSVFVLSQSQLHSQCEILVEYQKSRSEEYRAAGDDTKKNIKATSKYEYQKGQSRRKSKKGDKVHHHWVRSASVMGHIDTSCPKIGCEGGEGG